MRKVVFVLAIIGISVILVVACKKSSSDSTLSPARSLVGTWKTPSPTTFYYSTDFCSTYERVASFSLSSQWVITAGNSDTVNIEWDEISATSPVSIISPSCNYYVPWVFPTFLVGVVSSSQLTVYNNNVNVGSFSFTTNNITGTYNEDDCDIYCSGINTNSKTFILTN